MSNDLTVVKVPIQIAMDAAGIIFEIMRAADKDGLATQITLGPDAIEDMRNIMRRIAEQN